jgi:hypothetical protein
MPCTPRRSICTPRSGRTAEGLDEKGDEVRRLYDTPGRVMPATLPRSTKVSFDVVNKLTPGEISNDRPGLRRGQETVIFATDHGAGSNAFKAASRSATWSCRPEVEDHR